MAKPIEGPGSTPPHKPAQPKSPKPLTPSDSKYAFLLNSPFAKMFRAAGAMPTIKEMHAIINGIIKQQMTEMKRSDAEAIKAIKRMNRVIKGEE